jgi:hypothetical protein
MSRLRLTTVLVQLFGLLVVQMLETWRPGVIGNAVPLAWIWIAALITAGMALIASSDSHQDQSQT